MHQAARHMPQIYFYENTIIAGGIIRFYSLWINLGSYSLYKIDHWESAHTLVYYLHQGSLIEGEGSVQLASLY
jgi:hypothetical protein